MEKTINQQGPAQAGNEEGRDLFQRSVRDMVREGLLQMITGEYALRNKLLPAGRRELGVSVEWH